MFTHTVRVAYPVKAENRTSANRSRTDYRTHINVNDWCHWNTCKLMFTITRTWIPGLVLVSM